jgi:hypothetical protein
MPAKTAKMPATLAQRLRKARAESEKMHAAADEHYATALRRAAWEEGHSLSAIAAALGVSRQRVFQLIGRRPPAKRRD